MPVRDDANGYWARSERALQLRQNREVVELSL
jgi:hypothetical protein